MKILHIVPSYKPAYIYGGPIESVSKLCQGLAAAGHTVVVLTTTANGEQELSVEPGKVIDVDGVDVIYFKRITKDPTHISPDLWKYLWSNVESYDIVNIQSWWSILVIVAAAICHVKGAKVVISPRGMLSPFIFSSGYKKIKKVIHSSVGKWALSKSWLHATAQVEYNEFVSVLGECKGFIAPNSVTLPDTSVIKADNEIFTLIFMSRLHPKKGIEILLNAISKLSFPVILKIAGSGDDDYVKHLKAMALRLKVDSKIVWMNWVGREEKFNVLMNADLFVLVSLNENFANVVVEALHMGTPVLISKEVALSTFVNDHHLGWITSLDVDDVVEKLTLAYKDRKRMSWISENSRKIIAETFSEKKLIQNYVDHYQEIIETN
ncbi:Glycosyltransferase involved in cell wall bisynthesis [Pedobacter westerhofensis]|uniref:Glycosyltransferase involved in cell wall bisynthesis n=1 Tax=Pedobacter westerhofensis TaxID=425512 RepID=A0A521C5I7_9SPHI|nr:glycosyltransferase [Pedobacter westerhofensis]SMO54716.1 Glycosyltransferase involved in cell wall bisynthesis [Pedobacter westerhofensis]